jgi:capsular polysaccharide biosynthesis protein
MYDLTHKGNERVAPGGATQASATYAEVEPYFSVRDVLQILWKRLWVVILVALVSVGAAVGFSFWQIPVYEASTKLLVGQKQSEDQQLNLMGTVEGLQQLTHTMVEAVNSRPVAEEVIQRLGLQMAPQDLLDNLSVEQIEDTQFLLLSYRDPDPERAQKIVNYISDVSSERISEANASTYNITVTVWEDATVPNAPVSPDPVRNGLLALGLGLMLGTGLAFLLEYVDNSWRSPEEVEQVLGIPAFGTIPKFEVARGLSSRRTKKRRTTRAY